MRAPKKKKENRWICDFETCFSGNSARVWCWMGINYGTGEIVKGIDIKSFFEWALSDYKRLYFHNLKFDGYYLLWHILDLGYEYILDPYGKLEDKEFCAVITENGLFYQMSIKDGGKIDIIDSLKIIPMSAAIAAKKFGLQVTKGEIDYDMERPEGYKPTEWEWNYIERDCKIIKECLRVFWEKKLTKGTQASNAMSDYQKIFGKESFERYFPKLWYIDDIKKSYKGGWTYLKRGYEGKDLQNLTVLDVNSLYPYIMYTKALPYGEGIYFEGKPNPDKYHPLWIAKVAMQFEVKEGYLPTIQIKSGGPFRPTQYLESSEVNGVLEEVELVITSVDWEVIQEHYHCYNIQWQNGWYYKCHQGFFKAYIDKWMEIKIEADKHKNQGLRTLAKLMMNALYGKFGLSPDRGLREPYLDEENIVKLKPAVMEKIDGLYMPMASFITAYARAHTITAAQKCYDRFVYADTDSLHILGAKIPTGLIIDDFELGAWKVESRPRRARFLRQKTYIEEVKDKKSLTWNLEVKCAGMPNTMKRYVTWENFHVGEHFDNGKLKPKIVPGGVLLVPNPFTIS